MRALTRMRSLAAACALLLVVAGSAAAWVPGRPIDRGGSPTADPPMVGDPDQPPNMPMPIIFLGRVYLLRLPAGMMRPLLNLNPSVRSSLPVRSFRGARNGH